MRYLFLLLIVLTSSCSDDGAPLELTGKTMGTTYRILIAGPAKSSSLTETHEQIERKLIQINALMSTYDSESEISRFNRTRPGAPFSLHADTAEVLAFSLALADKTGGAFDPTIGPLVVLAFSLALADKTGGAFDPTIGPLVELWGFGRATSTDQAPPDDRIQVVKQQIGYQSLQLDTDAPTVKTPIGRQLDFSATAKGFAVDALAAILVQQGHSNFLVEIGGELFSKGEKRPGQPWRVAIEMPSNATRAIYRAFPLIDSAIATSGDYRNYFESNGQRFSHTIDPRTGYPITHATTSVTVVASTTLEADGWATALNVLGPVAGMQLAADQNLAVVMLVFEQREE